MSDLTAEYDDADYSMTMDKDLFDEWQADLLSGEIEQGEGSLEDSEGRQCCLGVLCNILVRRGLMTKELLDIDLYEFTDVETGESSTGVLPLPIARKVLDNENGVGEYALDGALTADNDQGKTFEKIAGIVRKVVTVRG